MNKNRGTKGKMKTLFASLGEIQTLSRKAKTVPTAYSKLLCFLHGEPFQDFMSILFSDLCFQYSFQERMQLVVMLNTSVSNIKGFCDQQKEEWTEYIRAVLGSLLRFQPVRFACRPEEVPEFWYQGNKLLCNETAVAEYDKEENVAKIINFDLLPLFALWGREWIVATDNWEEMSFLLRYSSLKIGGLIVTSEEEGKVKGFLNWCLPSVPFIYIPEKFEYCLNGEKRLFSDKFGKLRVCL